MAWTTPKTFVSLEVQTAADWNTHIRDNLSWIDNAGGTSTIAAWTSFTPTWTSDGVAPAIGNGTVTGTYMGLGVLTLWEARMTCGSTSTFGSGNYRWAAPKTMDGSFRCEGTGFIVDSGTATWRAVAELQSTSTIGLFTGATTLTETTSISPMTWANGDSMRIYAIAED